MEEVLEKAKLMAGVRLSNRGMDLYANQLVELDKIKEDYYRFKVKDDREDYEVEIKIDEFDYHCSCEYNSVTSAMCEHCIAAIKFISENKDIVRIIDKNVKYLLENYRNKLIVQAQVLLDDEKLHIEPTFEIKEHTMSLFYRVGVNKKYIIKDINVFLDAIHAEGKYQLNENEEIYLSIDKFTDSSKRLIDMLRSRHTMKELDYYHKSDGNRNFIVKGRNLDALFAYGYQYPVKIRKEEKNLEDMLFIPKPPKIKICFEKEEKYYILKHNVDFDVIERGNYGLYLLKDHIFYKGNVEYASKMEALLQTLNQNENIEIQEDLLYQFYNQVLKQVSAYVEFSGEILEKLSQVNTNLKLHLDIDNKGIPFVMFFKEVEGNRYYLLKEDSLVNEEILEIGKILFEYIARQEGDALYLSDSHEDFYEFINEGIPRLSSYVEIFVSEKVKSIRMRKLKSIGVGVSFSSGLLQFDFDFNEIDAKEMRKVIEAYREKRRFYRLKDGSFLDIQDEQIEKFVELIDDLGIESDHLEKEMSVESFRSLYLHKQIYENRFIEFKQDKSYVELIDEIQDIQEAKFEVVDALKDTLRDYQKYGYRWLKTMQKFHFGGILADDMGIGKTIQVLALLSDIKGKPSIVICPSSIVFNWKNEIEKFTPYLKCLIIVGNANQRQEKIAMINDYDVVITSYDYIKRDIEYYEEIDFCYQILDEAQYIKNFNTKNALSVKLINSKYRLALTGTPIENSLSELWSIMDFLMPNYLFSYYEFKQIYELPIIKEKDLSKQKRLAALISPFVLRRLKKDVLTELPDKIETDVFVEFKDEEKELYLSNVLQMKELLSGDKRGNKIYVLSLLTKLRQLCNDPRLLYENINTISSKMEACFDIIEQSIQTGKKILIFSQFTSLLEMLQEELDNREIDSYYLNGATPKLLRNQMVNDYNEDDVPVFLISLKAGGTGLNLTGAEVVIHFDPWWNISAQNQASDRAYRIGQKNVVQVFKLIMKDSIEEKILNIQSLKKELADAIIEENENNILNMSTEEILDLF